MRLFNIGFTEGTKIAAVLGVALLLLTGEAGHAQETGTVAVERDLLTALILEGMPCGEVTQATRNGETDYEVTCASGNRYRLHKNEEGVLGVVDLLTFPLVVVREVLEHFHIVKRGLHPFAALLGHPCDQVKEFERDAANGHSFTCEDGNRYHVLVAAGGQIVVEVLER